MKPVWLLDVDGVVNAISHEAPSGSFDCNSWARITAHNGFPILYCKDVIDFINNMSERVEVRWHTTWQNEALQLGEALGLKVFEVSESDYTKWSEPYGWWKMGAAIRVITEERRPLIWTDDDISRHEQQLFNEETSAVEGRKALLITPKDNYGLSRGNLNAIEEFVEEIESGDKAARNRSHATVG